VSYEGCQFYLICDAEYGLVQDECPDGSVFNGEFCNEEGDCWLENNQITDYPDIPNEIPNEELPNQELPNEEPEIEEPNESDVVCPDRPENEITFLPNSEGCDAYFICLQGNPFPFTCPEGQHFNFQKKYCDNPENVGCVRYFNEFSFKDFI
jgi:hypothetical protein